METENSPSLVWATLLTRPSYLAGVIILAYTLQKHGSRYPLVVLVTDTLPAPCIEALERERKHANLIIHHVDLLQPPAEGTLIAERFADTWTKLRVFQLTDYEKIVFLDADMMVMKNMDDIFEIDIPSKDWLAANHACVCNLDKDAWAPKDWTADNCAYTPLQHSQALKEPTAVKSDSRPTYHLLNSGMFMFYPSIELWDQMMDFFNTTPHLKDYKFPDQDFLADFFKDKWMPLGWQYNALKTMRYWHENIWRDDEVKALHYIVDKPWASRVGDDGKAGYLGRDGVTHTWWWKAYEEWEQARKAVGDQETVEIIGSYVASKDGRQESEELRAIGSQVQGFANNGQQKQDVLEPDNKAEQEHRGPGGPVLRPKRPGEHGHGPVVNYRHRSAPLRLKEGHKDDAKPKE